MVAPIYLGDETSAAGWRLAGLRTVVPEEGAEADALAAARTHAPLVLVAGSVAARIPEAALRAAQSALSPLILIVPDLAGGPVPDVAARLRHQLGLEG
jgi:vacuolar-type H+-ATPase subunit F/Vma7